MEEWTAKMAKEVSKRAFPVSTTQETVPARPSFVKARSVFIEGSVQQQQQQQQQQGGGMTISYNRGSTANGMAFGSGNHGNAGISAMEGGVASSAPSGGLGGDDSSRGRGRSVETIGNVSLTNNNIKKNNLLSRPVNVGNGSASPAAASPTTTASTLNGTEAGTRDPRGLQTLAREVSRRGSLEGANEEVIMARKSSGASPKQQDRSLPNVENVAAAVVVSSPAPAPASASASVVATTAPAAVAKSDSAPRKVLSVSSTTTEDSTAITPGTNETGKQVIPKEAKKKLTAAMKLFETKHLDEALKEFDLLESEFPVLASNGVFHLNKGGVYHQKNQFRDAVTSYKKACELLDKSSNLDSAYFYLGNSLKKLNELNGAVASFEKALEINPKNKDAMVQLVHSLNLLKRHEDAYAAVIRTAATQNNDSVVNELKMDSLIPLKRFKEAAVVALAMIKIYLPDGIFDTKAKNNGKSALPDVVETNIPGFPWRPEWDLEAQKGTKPLKTAFPELSDKARTRISFTLIKAAIDLETPPSDDANVAKLILLLRHSAVRAAPNHNSLVALNESLQSRGDFEGALLALNLACLANPNQFWAPFQKGALLLSLDRFEEAIPSFKISQGVKNIPDIEKMNIEFFLGNALVSCGRQNEAIACFREVASKGSGDIAQASTTSLITSLLRNHDQKGAAEALSIIQAQRSKLPASDPGKLAGNFCDEGRALIILNRKAEARRAFETALEKSPKYGPALHGLQELEPVHETPVISPPRKAHTDEMKRHKDDDEDSINSASLQQAGPPLRLEGVPNILLDERVSQMIEELFGAQNGGNDKVCKHVKEVFVAEGYERLDDVLDVSLEELLKMKGMRPGWCHKIWKRLGRSRSASGGADKPKLPPRPTVARSAKSQPSVIAAAASSAAASASASASKEQNGSAQTPEKKGQLLNALNGFEMGKLRKVNSLPSSATEATESSPPSRTGTGGLISEIRDFKLTSLKRAETPSSDDRKREVESKGMMGSLLKRITERRVYLQDEDDDGEQFFGD